MTWKYDISKVDSMVVSGFFAQCQDEQGISVKSVGGGRLIALGAAESLSAYCHAHKHTVFM